MRTLRLDIELTSQTLIGSGEGFGAVIDADMVFDDLGIPVIPAKRIKGCLRDAAETAFGMLQEVGLRFPDAPATPTTALQEHYGMLMTQVFGKTGEESGQVYFSNLTIADYVENRQWLQYLLQEYKSILSKESVMALSGEIRQQTAIDPSGIADDHSLRTIRVARQGMVFHGDLRVASDAPEIVDALALACLNLRRIGSKRNRGFGEVTCILRDEYNEPISIVKKLEGLCNA